MSCGRYITHRMGVESGDCLDCGHRPPRNEYERGVEAAIAIIEARTARVHSGAGGAIQPDITVREIRERLLST